MFTAIQDILMETIRLLTFTAPRLPPEPTSYRDPSSQSGAVDQ
ncbi:MAG: hypothetical protein RLZZ444_666 [Pseudomonadota bacterium]